jgi:hypothetical protein
LFLPLIAWAIWIGVYPKPYFDVLRQPVTQIVERVRPGYFDAPQQAGWQAKSASDPKTGAPAPLARKVGQSLSPVSPPAAPPAILARNGGVR